MRASLASVGIPAFGLIAGPSPAAPPAMIKRAIVVVFTVLPFIWSFLTYRKQFLLWGPPRHLTLRDHESIAKRLTQAVADLGPTFIKLVQIISSRADLLPEVYLKELRTLQDAVPPADSSVIREVIASELGRPVQDVFEDFSDEALASASLGQVHRARYRGQDVIVKVLKKGVEETVAVDLRIVFKIMGFLLYFLPSMHQLRILNTILEEFARMIEEELDFLHEAANIRRFQENFAGNPWVIIPDLIGEVNTRRVLVLRYHQGTRIDRIEEMQAQGIDVPQVIDRLIEIYGQMILVDGFFHADPHPGNIVVDRGGRIVLMDFGMVVTLDEKTRRELIRLSIAGARRDLDTLISSFYELELVDADINFAVLRDAVEAVMDILDRRTISQKRMREVADEIYRTFYRFPLRLPSNLVYLFKTAILVEGIGVRYDPSFLLIHGAMPALKRMVRRTLQEARKDIPTRVREKIEELYQISLATERIIRRMDRELFRVRTHPLDIEQVERFFTRLARRLLIGMLALGVVLVTTLLFLRYDRPAILILGLIFAFGALIVLIGLPGPGSSEGAHRWGRMWRRFDRQAHLLDRRLSRPGETLISLEERSDDRGEDGEQV